MKKKSKHIGFDALAHNAEVFYEGKGYSHEEAMKAGARVAGAVNAKYVHHYRGHKNNY